MSFIGPALPPHLMHLLQQREENDETETSTETKEFQLEKPEAEEEDANLYGPALPPGFQPKSESSQLRIIGPTLPPGISLGQLGADSGEEDDDNEIVGPMPVPSGSDDADYLQEQFESRARKMKNKLVDQDKEKPLARESWMLELPKNRTGLLGLEARSFRRNAGPDRNADTSEWTDTPEDKLRKAQGLQPEGSSNINSAAELEAIAIMERDKAMAKRAAKHASKRSSESLLDTHQKALNKKKKKEEEKPKQRQMFDREKDLQVNRFDEAQKKAVFNKAKLLDDRFSSGGQKYL